MNREIVCTAVAAPAANYAQAILTEGAGQMLHISGVVGTRPDGTIPDDVADQADVIWANIAAIVGEAGMVRDDIVSITTYVVADFMASLPEVMAAHDRGLQGRRVASTLVTVPALARPAWKMEIAVIAAR